MVREVIVAELPKCDFCSSKAAYDGKTRFGAWANMCEYHFVQHGIGLGTGKGQRLVLDDKQKTLTRRGGD